MQWRLFRLSISPYSHPTCPTFTSAFAFALSIRSLFHVPRGILLLLLRVRVRGGRTGEERCALRSPGRARPSAIAIAISGTRHRVGVSEEQSEE